MQTKPKYAKGSVVRLGAQATYFGGLKGTLCRVTEVTDNVEFLSLPITKDDKFLYALKMCKGGYEYEGTYFPERTLENVPVKEVARLKVKGMIE